MCHLRDLGVEVLHVLSKHLTKLAEHFFVPGVILQVHLGLDLLIENRKTFQKIPEKCSIRWRIKHSNAFKYSITQICTFCLLT